ncbi:MAG: hypothetical protein HPKKFMNG_02030 [Planctomycetes bacterium]|nr:hypothetical protein [Planctomycetota bacterium]
MGEINLMTFDKVMKNVNQYSTKHLLLGNGFSRACRNQLFAYDALFKEAEKHGLDDELKAVFAVLKTTDFEAVMRALRQCAILVEQLANATPLAKVMRSHAKKLRELLVKTIAGNHPARPSEIKKDEYAACRSFLAPFDRVYTLNYDLLLYWTVMQDELEPKVETDDGFRQPEKDPLEYVTWNVENSRDQRVFYLHGALHLFDAGHELQKYTWCNTGVALIDQIRTALEAERYPLFVSEGSSKWKLNRIQHSGYLSRGFRSLSEIAGGIVVYGHSMAENDEHIIKLLESRKSKLKYVAVSLFGDPAKPSNQHIIKRCSSLRAARKQQGNKVELEFFDAASAEVWG